MIVYLNMNQPIKVDDYSLATSALKLFYNEILLAHGTCFFWKHKNDIFLVTNWHNLSGRNALDKTIIHSQAVVPNKIMFDVWFGFPELNDRRQAFCQLEDNSEPLWIEHPKLGSSVDVACMKLPLEIAPYVIPMNILKASPLAINISSETFILGFPAKIGVKSLPIWKRASIASEPNIDVDDLPKFYVDTLSAQGMSGSPVILRTHGIGLMEGGGSEMGPRQYTRFIGIYSGRLFTGSSVDAQLGVVWKASVIEEIICGECKGKIC
jgi:hypothetical protein